MTEKAINKLDKEYEDCKKLSQKGDAVKKCVLDTLKVFCKQNGEFAQAVVQSSKPLKECVEYTVKDSGNSIPDIDVYKRAVQFYFPGADIHVVMTIDLGDGGFSNAAPAAPNSAEAPTPEEKKTSLSLTLDDLGIDW